MTTLSAEQREKSILQTKADRLLAEQISKIRVVINEPGAAEDRSILAQEEEKLGVAVASSRSYHPSLAEDAIVNRSSPAPMLPMEVYEAEVSIQALNWKMMSREDFGAVPNATSYTRERGSRRRWRTTRKEADNNMWWRTSEPSPHPAADGSIYPRNVGGISGRDFLENPCFMRQRNAIDQ